MPNATCKTCNTEFDATLRCPECRQTVPDPAVDGLARLTAAVAQLAPPALSFAIFEQAKKK